MADDPFLIPLPDDAEFAVRNWECPCGSTWDVRSPSSFVTVSIICGQCGRRADVLPGPAKEAR